MLTFTDVAFHLLSLSVTVYFTDEFVYVEFGYNGVLAVRVFQRRCLSTTLSFTDDVLHRRWNSSTVTLTNGGSYFKLFLSPTVAFSFNAFK